MVHSFVRTLDGANEESNYAGLAKVDKIALPKDHLIQRIIIDVSGDVDITTGVLVEDAGMALFDEIKLTVTEGKSNGGGNNNYITLSGVDLFFINYFDYQEELEETIPSANGTNSEVSFQLCIDFRLAKKDPEDWSVSIPSYDKSTITLSLSWVDLATGYLSSGGSNCALTARLTLIEGIPDTEEEFEAFKQNPKLTLNSTATVYANSTGKEKRNQDISVGALMRRLFYFTRTNAGVRSDAQINTITLRTLRDGFYYESARWDSIQAEDKMMYHVRAYDGNRTVTGLTIFDWARGAVDETGRVLGLDLTGLKSGDFKLEVDKASAQPAVRWIQENVEP